MTVNYHTHTRFCDGKNTPEEMVLAALEKGFSALGFSGHGYTPFDLRYCMKDTAAYVAEIGRLKAKYAGEIRIFLGIEEDILSPADRGQVDYLIGSSHYLLCGGEYYSLDSDAASLSRCLARFGGDPCRLAEAYYAAFCRYIHRRRPDIIGHFDLITKFDEQGEPLFLGNEAYLRLARPYAEQAARSGCLIEVNTGAMARGLRTAPYPAADLLHSMKQAGARLVLSADCHRAEAIDFGFAEARAMLREIGFRQLYALTDDGWCAYAI